MGQETPALELGGRGGGRDEVLRLLAAACAAYAARNIRQAADALCAAECLATHAGLHREAARLRKAITILAQGGKPRLLTRPGYLENNR